MLSSGGMSSSLLCSRFSAASGAAPSTSAASPASLRAGWSAPSGSSDSGRSGSGSSGFAAASDLRRVHRRRKGSSSRPSLKSAWDLSPFFIASGALLPLSSVTTFALVFSRTRLPMDIHVVPNPLDNRRGHRRLENQFIKFDCCDAIVLVGRDQYRYRLTVFAGLADHEQHRAAAGEVVDVIIGLVRLQAQRQTLPLVNPGIAAVAHQPTLRRALRLFVLGEQADQLPAGGIMLHHQGNTHDRPAFDFRLYHLGLWLNDTTAIMHEREG